MTLTFNFILSFGFWSWLVWIMFILAYLFLILGSNDLKKHNFVSTKLLFITGILLLIWYVLGQFIPTISLVSPTTAERIIFYIYTLFLTSGTIYLILNTILGIGFIKLGSNNRDRRGTLMLVGGILYLIMTIINLTVTIIFLNAMFFWTSLPPWFGYFFLYLDWTLYIGIIAAVILIFISIIFTKRALFIIFGALFLAVYSIQFLIFIGIL